MILIDFGMCGQLKLHYGSSKVDVCWLYILSRVESNLKYWTITMIKITWDYYNSVFYVCLTDQWNCHSIQIFMTESKHRESFQIINVFQPKYQYCPVFANTNVPYKWRMDYHKLGSHKLRWKSTQKTLLSKLNTNTKQMYDHLINLIKSLIVFSDISHHLYKEKSSFSLSYTWWCHNSTYCKSTIYVF